MSALYIHRYNLSSPWQQSNSPHSSQVQKVLTLNDPIFPIPQQTVKSIQNHPNLKVGVFHHNLRLKKIIRQHAGSLGLPLEDSRSRNTDSVNISWMLAEPYIFSFLSNRWSICEHHFHSWEFVEFLFESCDLCYVMCSCSFETYHKFDTITDLGWKVQLQEGHSRKWHGKFRWSRGHFFPPKNI